MSTVRPFPQTRLRRLRKHPWLRELTQEHQIGIKDLVLPLFVHEEARSEPVAGMSMVQRLNMEDLIATCHQAACLGIPAIALFPVVPDTRKDALGQEALREDNLINRAIRKIRAQNLDLGIICDCALDPYTDHSHDGVLQADGDVDNDRTIEILAQQAVTLATAGANMIAPSDMQDGRIGVIRNALDAHGFHEVSILSYTAKYASCFYGPFRNAVGAHGLAKSAYPGQKQDKQTYQMQPANRLEAQHIARQHLAEGADCLMVKPAMSYLDVILDLQQTCQVPVFAYQVSGELAMLAHYAAHMQMDLAHVLLESLLSCKRAGATAILCYEAIRIAQKLQEK